MKKMYCAVPHVIFSSFVCLVLLIIIVFQSIVKVLSVLCMAKIR